jgi:hypothetical protein
MWLTSWSPRDILAKIKLVENLEVHECQEEILSERWSVGKRSTFKITSEWLCLPMLGLTSKIDLIHTRLRHVFSSN